MKRTEEEKRLNARIGGNVRRRRAEKGMSQAELVEALVSAGVTDNTRKIKGWRRSLRCGDH